MNRTTETPIGQSAVSAGQAAPRTPAEEGTPQTAGGDRVPKAPAPRPVAGPTPDGQTAASAPSMPPPSEDPEVVGRQRKANVGNLSMLARQAIGNGMTTMQVSPQMVADLCVEYDRMGQASGGSVAPPEGALEAAEEKGRREAAAEFAEERAQLLQGIADLEARLTPVPEAVPEQPTVPHPSNEPFRGPGQPG